MDQMEPSARENVIPIPYEKLKRGPLLVITHSADLNPADVYESTYACRHLTMDAALRQFSSGTMGRSRFGYSGTLGLKLKGGKIESSIYIACINPRKDILTFYSCETAIYALNIYCSYEV